MGKFEPLPNSEEKTNSRIIFLEQKVLEKMFSDGSGNVDESEVVDFLERKEGRDAEKLRAITTHHLNDDSSEDQKVEKVLKEFSEAA